MMCEPFAMGLLRRHLGGSTREELATETGIPAERIDARLQAAAMYILARGLDTCLPVPAHRLKPFFVDWDLVWFD